MAGPDGADQTRALHGPHAGLPTARPFLGYPKGFGLRSRGRQRGAEEPVAAAREWDSFGLGAR